MIPKVIHYCWFGRGPMPQVAYECIESWKKFLPDYEIRLWNEDNFDINICTYTAEAYRSKKYAFVSDYARLWIINRYGGVYFDTDVKLLASPKAIIENGPFMGLETNGGETCYTQARSNPGLGIAGFAGSPLLAELLRRYETYRFISPLDGSLNLRTIVEYTTDLLHEYGFPTRIENLPVECAGFTIYPKDYFSPRSVDGRTTEITPRTVSIHLFTNTWGNKSFTHKIASSLKTFALDHILPKDYILRKLARNKRTRDLHFGQHFLITPNK
ncbi:MAG: glycosyl transferase [Muribaculum sp.]|nr:glycosyl transferase [Muribaculum sp.]